MDTHVCISMGILPFLLFQEEHISVSIERNMYKEMVISLKSFELTGQVSHSLPVS